MHKADIISRLKWKTTNWNRQNSNWKITNTRMKCMILNNHHTLVIPRIISGLEWVEHIMDFMDLAIQCIEPLIAIVVMFMLRHIELIQLVQHHPLKMWVHRASILWKVVGNQVHRSSIWLFLLICTTWTSFMVMCTTNNSSNSCPSISHLDKAHFCANFGWRYGSIVQLTPLAHPLHQYKSIQWI